MKKYKNQQGRQDSSANQTVISLKLLTNRVFKMQIGSMQLFFKQPAVIVTYQARSVHLVIVTRIYLIIN